MGHRYNTVVYGKCAQNDISTANMRPEGKSQHRSQPWNILSSPKAAKSQESKRIIGIWDLRRTPATLGGLLILVEELYAQSMIHKADSCGICFVGDISPLLTTPVMSDNEDEVVELDRLLCVKSPLLTMLTNLQGVDTCYQAASIRTVKSYIARASSTIITWPPLEVVDDNGLIDYKYATTIFLQDFYREHGSIPCLSVKSPLIRWAIDFVERYVLPSLPVVVHLKNNPYKQGFSNANLDEWLAFFEVCLTQFDVKFVLIGNEEIDIRIAELPNVLVSQNSATNLPRDLALVQISYAFMGMSSGPCNMALFSKIPYVIYKNLDHDAGTGL